MKEELRANQLKNISDVTKYWRQCLTMLTDEHDDNPEVAGYMVGVVSNDRDEAWRSGAANDAHPAYALIFELAADLEVPEDITNPRVAAWRSEQWQCVRALVSVLASKYLDE